VGIAHADEAKGKQTMSKRINGRLARPYVQRKEAFKNSNGQLYANWIGEPESNTGRYTVYSYGSHWPLFIYVSKVDTWFENKEKFGPTTSKHRTFTHPHCETVLLSLEQIKLLDRLGYSALTYERLTNG
jgi:hypothetical protein